MKRIITVGDEEHEIDWFLDFIDGKDSHIRKYYMEAFLRDKLDPSKKFIVSGYEHHIHRNSKDRKIIQEETDRFQDSNNFSGRNFEKFKLQIRLENSKDLENLFDFLQTIRPCLKQISDEEDINDKRKKILDDILKEPELIKYNSKFFI